MSAQKGPIPVRYHPLYPRWAHMRQCVYNPNHADYPRFGGRGIRISHEFDEFWNYVDLVETNLGPIPGPSNEWKLARLDQDKDFTIKNMAWSRALEVGHRLENAILIKYRGQELTINEWSEITGVNYATMHTRLELGWKPAQILGYQLGPRLTKIEKKKNEQQRMALGRRKRTVSKKH